ncbi:MAG: hypothetical protein MUO76_09030 [Anaerolineaceae bacterium]|nr:hypothetical protein [Anaerolineaceae bacterium]
MLLKEVNNVPERKKPDEYDMVFESLGIMSPKSMMNYITGSMRKDQESKTISLNTTISAGLNKFPANLIDGVTKAHRISTKDKKKDKIIQIINRLTTRLDEVIENLPPEPRGALKLVIEAGGWVRYNQLSNKYGGEENDSYFWGSEPPTSAIGILRSHALLFTGKAGIKGRMYKVAVVPIEVRKQLEEGDLIK